MSVEKFKTHRDIDRERKKQDMLVLLQKTMDRVEADEITGMALATASISGNPDVRWIGWNAATLGNAIASLFHRYFKAQS